MQESGVSQQEQNLLQQPPGEILKWLERAWSDQQILPAGFNWLGLAETAGTRANARSDVQWADVAIRVYTCLASQTKNETMRDNALDSAMNLRASMIIRYGAKTGHPVLDSSLIKRWFYEQLDWPYEEVLHKAKEWKGLPLEEIQALHRIKTRLKVLKLLVEHKRLQADEQLNAWLALSPGLP